MRLTGIALVITDLATGRRTEGAIVGDTVSYVEIEEGEIAAASGYSKGTVRYYLKQSFRKLNIQRQAQLVRAVMLAVYGCDHLPGGDRHAAAAQTMSPWSEWPNP